MTVREPLHRAVVTNRVRGGVYGRGNLCRGQSAFFEPRDRSHGANRNTMSRPPQQGVTMPNSPPCNASLRCTAQNRKKVTPRMAWYDNAARLLRAKGVSNAEIGRRLDMSGQAISLKLAGKRRTSVTEAKVFAEFAGVTVAEMLGEEAYLIEVRDEKELIELYRLLTPAQREQWLAYGRFLAAKTEDA